MSLTQLAGKGRAHVASPRHLQRREPDEQVRLSGFRNQLHQDRTLALFHIQNEAEYRLLEQARTIAHADDTRQLTALAIAATRADILCLQEVDNIEALKAFEYGYLFKMVGQGYRQKYTTSGNDSRGIDVAVMMRAETAHGQPIEFVRMTSHAHVTFADFGLHTPELAALGNEAHERIFRRDCLEIDVTIGGRPLTIYSLHFKSMGSPRNGLDGREATMPIRIAEAQAVRRIIEDRFGKDHAGDKRWVICGDLNDYRQRVLINGDAHSGYSFEPVDEAQSSLNVLLAGGFAENIVERRPELDRWTLYHTRGPQERHLCQLDYILLSPALARHNAKAVPDIIRGGQPGARPFRRARRSSAIRAPAGTGPKASDHCPGRRDARHSVRSSSMSFALPRGVILPVDEIDVRLDPSPHPFERDNARGDRRKLAARDRGQAGAVRRHGRAAVRVRLWRRQAVRPLPCGALLDLPLLAQGSRSRRPRTPSRIPCW